MVVKVKVNINGTMIDAEPMTFNSMAEPWSSYQLPDGTTIKLKLVVSSILKLPTLDPVTGLPQFLIQSTNVASVEPPPIKGISH